MRDTEDCPLLLLCPHGHVTLEAAARPAYVVT